MNTNRFRDLTLIDFNEKEKLVVACDSLGAIGSKEKDLVKVPAYVVGRIISRVPILEVLASGALPVSIINTLTVEMNPTGAEIIRGIADEIKDLDLDPSKLINGSTEDNVPTLQTGVGITVLGRLLNESTKLGTSKLGDKIFVIGLPKVGEEVFLDDPETMDIKTMLSLLTMKEVHEILPVGSKGIQYEAELLASGVNCSVEYNKKLALDINKSGGPASCIVISVKADSSWNKVNLSAKLKKPVSSLGELIY